jgi:hypothetical protein
MKTVINLALILLELVGRASAGVLIDNTDQPLFSLQAAPFPDAGLAIQFQTGAARTNVDSVGLYVLDDNSPLTPPTAISVAIFADASGAPGSVLSHGSLDGPTTPVGTALRSYAADGLILDPLTHYWVVISEADVSHVTNYSFGLTASTTYASPQGWTYFSTFDYQQTPAPFNDRMWFTALAPNRLLLSINGSNVPEPSALALLAIGVVGWLAIARRKSPS